MKKILFSIVLVLLLVGYSFAQVSNAQTSFNAKYDGNGNYVVKIGFTADSTATGFVTSPFVLPQFDLDYTVVPATFVLKTVSTYGVPKCDVFLQGMFATGSDTLSLDTLRLGATNQTEADTIGALTLNQERAPSYKVFIRDATADVNAGTITLIFPVKPATTLYDLKAR